MNLENLAMARPPLASAIQTRDGRRSISCWQHLWVDRCCQRQTDGCGDSSVCGECDKPSTDDRWPLITHNVQLHTARWSIEHEVAENNRPTCIFSTSLSIVSVCAHGTDLSPNPPVGLCVSRSVSLPVWKVYCGKMAEWIRMPFGMVSGVSRGMCVLDGWWWSSKGKWQFCGWIWGITL